MMTGMRDVMLHGGTDEAFDRSVLVARRLAESFGARRHVVYTVDEPIGAGWTSEIGASKLLELQQGVEAEARDRLARLIPLEEQARLRLTIVLRTGPAASELVAYTKDENIDLAIVQVPLGDDGEVEHAQALLRHGRCGLLVLR
jgi:nucleotide-binding universal stress UspA family protein